MQISGQATVTVQLVSSDDSEDCDILDTVIIMLLTCHVTWYQRCYWVLYDTEQLCFIMFGLQRYSFGNQHLVKLLPEYIYK